VSDPVEDKELDDYLRRKSALSLGYKKIYLEAPPPELDRAVKERAKRALRWLLPGIVSLGIALAMVFSVNYAIQQWLGAMVAAEKNLKRLQAEQDEAQRKEDLNKPVVVAIDAQSLSAPTQNQASALSREQWLAQIEALRRAGKKTEADTELRRLQAAYPDNEKK